ncbi:Retrovirus-related Pol polyprotein from transposon TNT 1-94 [Gossypium australe]|uniref:Retrovirus-related Pol polyprotein from transposon TNT 1-94 n=1 Tax=Gossypium australe TaxID=47621 RepID=A0A5B6UG16_9ROSI|nr:Retrovirus-related Pol polyprotein from transposon TNT 1-94 [Gossypium australe]
MLIAAKDPSRIDQLKIMFNSNFDMKDLGAAKKILGMKMSRDRSSRKIFLSRQRYIERILDQFGMQNSKLVSTPLAGHFGLSTLESPQTKDKEKYMPSVIYSSEVGSLMYEMVCTRPNISHVVSVVSRCMARLDKLHGKQLSGRSSEGLVGFIDSNYVGYLNQRRSLIGYLFVFEKYAISWKAIFQTTVALLITIVEYMTITEAMKEAIWLRGLFRELFNKHNATIVYCDSQSVIHLNEDQHHERTKYINIQYHFVREVITQ